MKNTQVNGLRGIAAFNVAIHHFMAAFLPSLLHKNLPTMFPANENPGLLFKTIRFPLFTVVYNGHLPVLAFFVISGYVLTAPYFFDAASTSVVLKKRLWGRYLRLNIPIAIAIALSFFIYRLGGYNQVGAAARLSGSASWFATFFPAHLTIIDAVREALYGSIFFGKSTFVNPLWSLQIEFLGSMYIILYYLVVPKNRFWTSLLFVLCLLYAFNPGDSLYFFAIFAGSLLNRIKRPRYRTVLFAIGLYLGCFQHESILYNWLPDLTVAGHTLWPRYSVYSAVAAICLTASVIKGFGKQVFDHSIAQFLGKISFALYLLHFIVLCSLSSFIYLRVPQDKWGLMLNFSIYVLVAVLASVLFEKYVDCNAIKVSHKFTSDLDGQRQG